MAFLTTKVPWLLALLLVFNPVCAKTAKKHFNSSCHEDSEDWSREDVPTKLKEWLRSAKVVQRNKAVNFPKIRSVFRGKRLDFVSADPSTNGLTWKRMGRSIYNGFLYGNVDDNNNITGSSAAFIFNNMEVAFYGAFVKDVMVEAQDARVTACRCKNGIMELQFTVIPGQTSYHYEELREWHPTKSALVMDPLDRANVNVGISTLEPIDEYNEGLFAKRDLSRGDVIVMLGGVLQPTAMDDYDRCNMTEQLTDDLYKNIIQFNDTHRIDVPPNYDQLHQYRATLGHKANHHFNANADYERTYSPRFGPIQSLIALRKIAKGEEIFCDYNYDPDYAWTPEWYIKLHQEKVEREEKMARSHLRWENFD